MPAGVATRSANDGVSRLALQVPAGTGITDDSLPATDENEMTPAGAGIIRRRLTTGALAVKIPNVTPITLNRMGADAPAVRLGRAANTSIEMPTVPALIVTRATGDNTSGLSVGFGAALDIVV